MCKGDRASYNGRMGTVTQDSDQFWVTASVQFDDEPGWIIQKDKGDLIVTERAPSPFEVVAYVDYELTEDGWRITKNAW